MDKQRIYVSRAVNMTSFIGIKFNKIKNKILWLHCMSMSNQWYDCHGMSFFLSFFFNLFCFLRRIVHWQLAPYSLDVSLQTFQKAVCFIFHSQTYYICICWKKPTSPPVSYTLWDEVNCLDQLTSYPLFSFCWRDLHTSFLLKLQAIQI